MLVSAPGGLSLLAPWIQSAYARENSWHSLTVQIHVDEHGKVHIFSRNRCAASPVSMPRSQTSAVNRNHA